MRKKRRIVTGINIIINLLNGGTGRIHTAV